MRKNLSRKEKKTLRQASHRTAMLVAQDQDRCVFIRTGALALCIASSIHILDLLAMEQMDPLPYPEVPSPPSLRRASLVNGRTQHRKPPSFRASAVRS